MTKKLKHTPGPWVAQWRKSPHLDQCIIGQSEEIPFCMAGVIAKGQGFSDAEVESNARLIAAAPEMLEALEYAVAQLDTEDLDKAMQVSLDAWVVSTRGLIAKARGGE